jgi:hypothetical protein
MSKPVPVHADLPRPCSPACALLDASRCLAASGVALLVHGVSTTPLTTAELPSGKQDCRHADPARQDLPSGLAALGSRGPAVCRHSPGFLRSGSRTCLPRRRSAGSGRRQRQALTACLLPECPVSPAGRERAVDRVSGYPQWVRAEGRACDVQVSRQSAVAWMIGDFPVSRWTSPSNAVIQATT